MKEVTVSCCLMIVLSVSSPCPTATLIVDLGGGKDFREIQPALDAAADGDTVLVAPGEYVVTEPIDFNRLRTQGGPEIPPLKNITLRSETGPGATVIRRSEEPVGKRCVVIFTNGEDRTSVLDGFWLTGGRGWKRAILGPYGGGVYSSGSSPTVRNCMISGNSAQDWISTDGGTALAGRGGGVYVTGGSPSFANCTISGNSAGHYGSGIYFHDSSPTLTNCIVWGNVGGAETIWSQISPRILYSCIEGNEVWDGEGNINTDPFFVQPGQWENNGTPDDPTDDLWVAGDYQLQPESPCIDTGTSRGVPTTDIEGNGRPCGAGVDMGAYEMGDCPRSTMAFVRGNADGLGNRK